MASSFNHLRVDFVTIEPEWSFIQASETNCPWPQLSRRAFQFSISIQLQGRFIDYGKVEFFNSPLDVDAVNSTGLRKTFHLCHSGRY